MKRLYRMLAVLSLTMLLLAIPVGAQSEYSYVLDTKGQRIPSPLSYQAVNVVYDFGEAGSLSNPQDLYIDNKDNIYVLDTGNNRVLRLNKAGEVIGQFTNREQKPFSDPEGLFVDEDGDLYIADTGNQRIVHVTAEDEFVEEFVQPTSELYDDNYAFRPTKVAVSQVGSIYALNKDDYHGFVVLNAHNDFLGYFGSTKLPFDFSDWLARLVSTPEQKEKLGRRIPPLHSNFIIDEQNMIYTTTVGIGTEQVKKYSPNGENIFPKKDNFGETTGDYILTFFGSEFTQPRFTDLSVNDKGIVTTVDSVSSQIYQYDSEGMLLTVFGGIGTSKGTFMKAVALDQDSGGRIYVLDAQGGAVHVFEPTEFIQKIHHALDLYQQGKYLEAMTPWQEILQMDETYPVAYKGMGKAYIKLEQYKEAMEQYASADDKVGYSAAFDQYRQELYHEYFVWIALGAIVLVIGIAKGLGALYHLHKKR